MRRRVQKREEESKRRRDREQIELGRRKETRIEGGDWLQDWLHNHID